jgi:hypothetical protein
VCTRGGMEFDVLHRSDGVPQESLSVTNRLRTSGTKSIMNTVLTSDTL